MAPATLPRRGGRRRGPSPLLLAAAAAVVAGIVAVRGRPDARPLVPLEREPAPLRRLAAWDPPGPSSPLGRVAARAWAAPMTLAGLVLGAASGGRWERDGDVLLVRVSRGPVHRLLASRGFVAATLGHVVLATRPLEAQLLAHERTHTRQAEHLGPLFGPAYLGLLALYGYRDHPFERAARRRGQRAVDSERG